MKQDERNKLVEELKDCLVAKAKGYSKTVQKGMKVKCIEYDSDTGKKLREVEKVQMYNEEVYFPPDTNALLSALNIYDKTFTKDNASHALKKKELKLKEKSIENASW